MEDHQIGEPKFTGGSLISIIRFLPKFDDKWDIVAADSFNSWSEPCNFIKISGN